MDSRVRSIGRLVREYDSKLLARRDAKGVIHIYRKKQRADTFDYEGQSYVHTYNVDDYVISLTDTWIHDGRPVEWGLEPLWQKFCQMDSWRDDTGFAKFCESRERYERDRERQSRNTLRAQAADARRDFAKATNDLVVRHGTRNTSKVFL